MSSMKVVNEPELNCLSPEADCTGRNSLHKKKYWGNESATEKLLETGLVS